MSLMVYEIMIITSIHAKLTCDECQPYQIIMYASKGLDDDEYSHVDTSSLRCIYVSSKGSMATLLVNHFITTLHSSI